MKTISASLLLTLILASTSSFAAANYDTTIWQMPTATIWAFGGQQLIGRGQGLIPFGSNNANSIFYGALEAAGSFKKNNGYAAGVAAGYRKIINNSYILGGYLFVDYNRSPSSYNFWVANPGLEVLGNIWDFRVNGYIPTTCRHWLGNATLAENLGITQFEKAIGHNRYDHLFQDYEEAGSGLDAEIGRLIPISKTHNLRAYIGGYHYFMHKTDAITGAEGRIVYPLNHYIALEARDSYDKVRKNVFMGGIRITLGGYNKEDQDSLGITTRLAEPIEHNFGNLASANSVAVNKAYIDKGNDYHLPGSFWYFDNTITKHNSIGDGTYEHPFNAIDSQAYQLMTNSGALSQNVKMYIATGMAPYDLGGMPNYRLTLPDNYAIYGRTAHFTLAATGNQRPTLDGGMAALGHNYINDIQLNSQNHNFGALGALFLNEAKSVKINDVNINVYENKTDAYGIGAFNSFAVINNSVITATSPTAGQKSLGIGLLNSSVFIKNNNFIQAITNGNGSDAAGILGTGTVKIFGNNNQITADTTGTGSSGVGIFNLGGTIILSGNNNYITAKSIGNGSNAGGINGLGMIIISGNNNHILADSVPTKGGSSIGIFGTDPLGMVTISGNNNQIIANSAGSGGSNSGGIIGLGAIAILGNNNQIAASDTSGESNSHILGILDPSPTGAIIITGNNNQISAHSSVGECWGIFDVGAFDLYGSNNLIQATSTNHNAWALYSLSGDVTINPLFGSNTLIAKTTAANSNAYGIYLAPSTTAPKLQIKNTIFDIAATSGGEAAAISLPTQTDASKIMIRNNVFNVSASGTNSKAYGIFLPNATTPAFLGNIANNIFNITNRNMPSNAWGVYANAKWKWSAAWIRMNNQWINPTFLTPQQQVFTN